MGQQKYELFNKFQVNEEVLKQHKMSASVQEKQIEPSLFNFTISHRAIASATIGLLLVFTIQKTWILLRVISFFWITSKVFMTF